jgi:GTP-binding protein
MRRQGYEFSVSKPQVYLKKVDGVICEPIERLVTDVPEEYVGTVIDSSNQRKAELLSITPTSDGYSRLEFLIPSRGLIGYRSEMLTKTKGSAVVNSIFDNYHPKKAKLTTGTGVR